MEHKQSYIISAMYNLNIGSVYAILGSKIIYLFLESNLQYV